MSGALENMAKVAALLVERPLTKRELADLMDVGDTDDGRIARYLRAFEDRGLVRQIGTDHSGRSRPAALFGWVGRST